MVLVKDLSFLILKMRKGFQRWGNKEKVKSSGREEWPRSMAICIRPLSFRAS
jgi:hypothetical protein